MLLTLEHTKSSVPDALTVQTCRNATDSLCYLKMQIEGKEEPLTDAKAGSRRGILDSQSMLEVILVTCTIC